MRIKSLRDQFIDAMETGERPTPWDWISPFHIRDAKAMFLDYPMDRFGRKVPGSMLEIVLDPRPEIMIPPRQTYIDPVIPKEDEPARP